MSGHLLHDPRGDVLARPIALLAEGIRDRVEALIASLPTVAP